MAQEQPSNIKPFRKRIHINLGTIIFGLVFVYIVCCVILYFTRNRVSIYEVQAGSIVENQTYTGLALRTEQVVYGQNDGNLTYIAHEGSRVSPRTPVYSITEGESLADAITGSLDGSETLSADDYELLYNEITGFSSGFDANNFVEVYLFKSGVNSTVLDALHSAAFSDSSQQEQRTYGINVASDSGVVAYYMDGMENITWETFDPNMLDKKEYSREDFRNKETTIPGQPVYKIVTDENWEVIINIDDSQKEKYVDDEYIQVRFLKDQESVWAQIANFEKDGDWFCRLRFTNSMVRYVSERFLDVEVLLDSTTGLKVPNSAIVEKEFFTVPREYLIFDEAEDKTGLYIQKIDKDGISSESYREVTPYNLTDEEAYLNMDDIKEGTVVVKQGTSDLYTIKNIGKLVGVYNVNRGYADFSIVTMLYQNDDYSIVKANESYGLTQFDHIVLDGSSVNDEETIYQ